MNQWLNVFVVDIPFGVQESHEGHEARDNCFIFMMRKKGNNQGMYGLFKQNKNSFFTL